MERISSPTSVQFIPAQDQQRLLRGVKLISVLTALLLTLFLEALDGTVVGILLPRISGSLQGLDRYTWAITAYLLASVTMIPIVGKLSDQFGRRWFLISGVSIFLLGSALSGISLTMTQFIIFRALQGLGAGIGIALVNTVIGDIFSPAKRARWEGIFGSVYVISSLVGPALGGWFADHGPLLGTLITEATRWRWVFYLNLPFGMIALIALITCLPANVSVRTAHRADWHTLRRIDVSGTLLMAVATICLLLGLTWGSSQFYDWTSLQVIGMLVMAGIFYCLFIVNEHFAVEPILPLDLFLNQIFAADAALSVFQGMVMLGLVVILPLLLLGVQGLPGTSTGAMITAFMIGVVIGAGLSSVLIPLFKRYQPFTIIGALLLITGVFFLTRATSFLEEAISLGLAGVGMGPLFIVLTLAAQNTLPRTRLGVGTGAINYLNQVGQIMGTAFIGAVINTTLASGITRRLPAGITGQLSADELKNATNPQLLINATDQNSLAKALQSGAIKKALANTPAGQPPDQLIAQTARQTQHLLDQIVGMLKLSLADAVRQGLMVILVFCVLALVATLFLKDTTLRSSAEESEGEDTSA